MGTNFVDLGTQPAVRDGAKSAKGNFTVPAAGACHSRPHFALRGQRAGNVASFKSATGRPLTAHRTLQPIQGHSSPQPWEHDTDGCDDGCWQHISLRAPSNCPRRNVALLV